MMKWVFSLICIAVAMIATGCDSSTAKPVLKQIIHTERIVTGRVQNVHMLGEAKETVTVCHFDPRYVVVVQTDDGVERLAIHSPTQTFAGMEPVGKSYRFYLAKSGNQFLLEKVEELQP